MTSRKYLGILTSVSEVEKTVFCGILFAKNLKSFMDILIFDCYHFLVWPFVILLRRFIIFRRRKCTSGERGRQFKFSENFRNIFRDAGSYLQQQHSASLTL